MAENTGKTIEELKNKVHSGLDLLSDEELAAFFTGPEVGQQAPVASNPSVAPTPADATPPVAETAKGQADLLNLVPEKFRDKDEAASLTKMVKALQDSEAELTRRSQELSQLQNVVQELSRKPREEYRVPQQVTPPPAVPKKEEEPTEVEMDDLTFLDAPVNNAKAIAASIARKVAREVAREISVEQIRDYDTFATRRTKFEQFRSEHPDFDSVRTEFAEACKLHPEWDNDINGLPKLYDLAKTLAKAKNVAPAVTPAQPAPAVDVEKMKAEIRAEVEASAVEKAKQAILAEIQRRKAAAGIVSSSPGSTPAERVQPNTKTVELTPEDRTFKDMMDAGPNRMDRSLGQYGDILSMPH